MNHSINIINTSSAWAKLQQHQSDTCHLHMKELFRQDATRFQRFSVELDGLLLDYSKNRITARTLELLFDLATAAELSEWMRRMKAGERINISEDRAVLHTGLRLPVGTTLLLEGKDIVADVHSVLARMKRFTDAVRQHSWKGFTGRPITDVVNLGIGGSDLGPSMVTEALTLYGHTSLSIHFVSNIGGQPIVKTLERLNPATTLFIVVSKSFTTPETLLNVEAAKDWLLRAGRNVDIARHFVAVSMNTEAAVALGMDVANIFPLWDWVGGRYSIWSAVGLSVMLSIGYENFRRFLDGAYTMDQHFFSAPFSHNIPVILGLLGIWYNNLYCAHTHAIMPYNHGLRQLPAYLQQLDMESNGKCVGRWGDKLDFDTGPIIWGGEGVNSQHAFFQLLHQGTRLIPCDFIVLMNSDYAVEQQHKVLVANCFAQTEALMRGKTEAEVMEELGGGSTEYSANLLSQKVFPGNQPSNTIALDRLTPYLLGMVMAMYEHKVFVQGVIWGINSFDQWGVEYGKQLTQRILPALSQAGGDEHDCSTQGLITHFRTRYGSA